MLLAVELDSTPEPGLLRIGCVRSHKAVERKIWCRGFGTSNELAVL